MILDRELLPPMSRACLRHLLPASLREQQNERYHRGLPGVGHSQHGASWAVVALERHHTCQRWTLIPRTLAAECRLAKGDPSTWPPQLQCRDLHEQRAQTLFLFHQNHPVLVICIGLQGQRTCTFLFHFYRTLMADTLSQDKIDVRYEIKIYFQILYIKYI